MKWNLLIAGFTLFLVGVDGPASAEQQGTLDPMMIEKSIVGLRSQIIDQRTFPSRVVNTGAREIVIVEGKSGVFSNTTANAIPEGFDPSRLSACKSSYEEGGFEANAVLGKYRNLVKYRINYQYGCTANGKGRFIKSISIMPTAVNVGMPYYVRAVAYIGEPYLNDEAAYVNIRVAMTISSSGQSQSASQEFLLTGL